MARHISPGAQHLYRAVVTRSWPGTPDARFVHHQVPGEITELYGPYDASATAAWVASYFGRRAARWSDTNVTVTWDVERCTPTWEKRVPATWEPIVKSTVTPTAD